MRRRPGTDDIDLPNEDEIEAALNAAIDLPLDDLLSIEEFKEKFAPVAEAPLADPPAGTRDEDEFPADAPATLAFPLPAGPDDALPQAA